MAKPKAEMALAVEKAMMFGMKALMSIQMDVHPTPAICSVS